MDNNKRYVLILVLMSYFITALDGSIVITGLTKIAADLRLSQVALSWIQNAYVLAWGGFMLLGGKLSDTFGRKPIMIIALLLFGIGSLFAGIADSALLMIPSRFIQGLASAIMAPTSLALIMDYFDGKERIKAVAWYSSISGLGMCVGLVVGGALAAFGSWRIGFLINVPLTAYMIFISSRYLKASHKNAAHKKFDIAGTVLSVAGIFTFIYAINGADNWLWWMVVAIALATVFIKLESHCETPILPLRIFGNQSRNSAYIARLLFTCAMMGFHFFVSEYLQQVKLFTPLQTGIAYFPLTISTFIGALEVPKFVGKYGNRRVLFFGLAMMIVGFLSMLRIDGESSYWAIAIPMLFIGFGQGLAMSPMTNLGIAGVAGKDAGVASGLVNAAHQIGCSLGLSVMVAATGNAAGFANAFHLAMIIGVAFITASFISIFMPLIPRMLNICKSL